MYSFPFIGIFFAIIMIIFLLSRGISKLPDKIALVFILFLTLPLVVKIFMHNLIFLSYGKYLSIESYYLLYGFLLYIYVKSVIDSKFILRKIYILHLIPVILFTVWQIYYPLPKPLPPPQRVFTIDSVEGKITEKPLTLTGDSDFQDKAYGPEAGIPPDDEPVCKAGALVFYIFLIVSTIIYSILSLIIIYRKKSVIINYTSISLSVLNNQKMQWLTICFICSTLFLLITAQVKPKIFLHPLSGNNDSSDIAITFFIISMIIFKTMQSIEQKRYEPVLNNDNAFTKKYERSGLKEKEAAYYLNVLENFMKEEKPYLDCDLTISDLSEKIKIPRHYLTQIINEKLNKNFFMYINEYRINEIKNLMSDSQFENYTILRLAYQVGFNSKSRFNKAFKKFTGHTPSEYKKNISHFNNTSKMA